MERNDYYEYIIIAEEDIEIDYNSKHYTNIIKSLYKYNKNSNIFDQLYKDISSLNFGSITDISSQLICINIKGGNIFELLSSGSPFNFEKFKNNVGSSTQTIVNHIDVILHHKSKNNVNLFVRRSFSEHLYEWLVDSSNFV